MRFLPTAVHGIIDYAAALLLIALPWILDWPDSARWVMTILGVGVVAYSLITDYEQSVAKILPMSAHLALDALGGLVLIATPFVAGIDDNTVVTIMVLLGVFEIGAAMVTKTRPNTAERVM